MKKPEKRKNFNLIKVIIVLAVIILFFFCKINHQIKTILFKISLIFTTESLKMVHAAHIGKF
jgi:hypothetical protein